MESTQVVPTFGFSGRNSRCKKDIVSFCGFYVQVMLKGDKGIDSPKYCRDCTTDINVGDDGHQLMLKIKFLPYVVRAFGCQSGLKLLEHKGILGFEEYTLNLLMKWGMSSTAINTWKSFFLSWGSYANEMLQQNSNHEVHFGKVDNDTFHIHHHKMK
eukprot:1365850-Ditylum_brightwellii.AAC.1